MFIINSDHCFLQITESDQTKQDLINNHIKEIEMLKQSFIDEKKVNRRIIPVYVYYVQSNLLLGTL